MVKIKCNVCGLVLQPPYYIQQGLIRTRVVCREHIHSPCGFNITETLEVTGHEMLPMEIIE